VVGLAGGLAARHAAAALSAPLLRGVATGDFATTLDRAAAFARIVATGRAHLADDTHDLVRSASKLVELADQLQTAARTERAGNLW
jgi:hypothetical protein